LFRYCGNPFTQITYILENARILLANSNQWYFNNLVKRPCHKTPYRCPHRLNLSSQSSRSCAVPNIKALKDKDLEFANGIRNSNTRSCTETQSTNQCRVGAWSGSFSTVRRSLGPPERSALGARASTGVQGDAVRGGGLDARGLRRAGAPADVARVRAGAP
jgi:hypothetical protein